MRQRWPWLIVPILALLLGIVLYGGLKRDPHRIELAANDLPFPDFSLTQLQRPEQRMTRDQLLGKVTVINVWASWCASCKQEMSALGEIARHHPNIQFYGLNYRDERQAALNTLQRYGNPYHQSVYDPQGSLALAMGVYGTPETWLIDADGVIRQRYAGEMTPAIWQQQFMPLLAQWAKVGGS